jgi:hypothetical protein
VPYGKGECGEALGNRIWKLLGRDKYGLISFEEAVTAFGEICRGDSSARLRIIARSHQPPAFCRPELSKEDSEKYMLISHNEMATARDKDLTDSIDLVGKVEMTGKLLTNNATEDFFPEHGDGDMPRGNRLGGGSNDMSGSGTWAGTTQLDTSCTPSRPESLSLVSESRETPEKVNLHVYLVYFSQPKKISCLIFLLGFYKLYSNDHPLDCQN